MGIPYCCEAQAVRRRHPGESHEGRQRRRPKRAVDEPTRYAVKARTEMVHRVLEVLREEAFQLSRNIGIESLTARGGLHGCISKMRSVVFPVPGQPQGALARQGGESVLAYVTRRRRW